MEYPGGHWAREASHSVVVQRYGPSLFITILVHLFVWWVLNLKPEVQLRPIILEDTPYKNFVLVQTVVTSNIPIDEPIVPDRNVPAPSPKSTTVLKNQRSVETNSETIKDEELDDVSEFLDTNNQALSEERVGVPPQQNTNTAGPEKNLKPYIPSRWALEPPLSKQNLEKSWAADVDCLRSLSEDCKDLREAVFADYRLTETQKVWTPKHADSGMSSDFYGMSEHAILKKLGVNLPGENGQVLIPGVLAIDGPLWDKLHGVNKTCGLKRDVREGSMAFARDCP